MTEDLDAPLPLRESWDHYFIRMAMQVATRSMDPSTKVGCVLVGAGREVLSTGYNDMPRGVRSTYTGHEGPRTAVYDTLKRRMEFPAVITRLLKERWSRPEKYKFVEHAERNAVYNAARHGTALLGCTAYMNYEPCPCADCTRALIQVGCVRIVGPAIPFPGKGAGSHYVVDGAAESMRTEAGLEIVSIRWGT